VHYIIEPDHKLVVATVTGSVSPAEMFAYQAALGADPQFSPDFDSVTDFVDAAPFTGTPDDIRRLAQDGPFTAGVRRAFVVSSELHFGLSRMAQALAEIRGVQIEIFQDRASAFAWLGRAEPER
jgi:hypothetical protein